MGRIASKLISEIRKHKSRKVVDLAAARTGRKQAEELQKTVTSREELAALLPSHAVYVAAENQISVLSELLSALPQTARFVELIGQAEDEYLPAGPPMSPLTRSYFTCWALFDACVGIDKETIGTCILQLGPALGLDAGFLGIVRSMQESRMGFYCHDGQDGDCIILRELVTGQVVRALTPSGYRGHAGELWLVRVLPPPGARLTEHVAFTTPYVIIGPEVDAWLAYFRRTLGKDVSLGSKETTRAYERLLKWGPNRRYWSEYIFEAYVNHQPGAIFLTGLPDVPESRPHAILD
jgi:hypothetical protein